MHVSQKKQSVPDIELYDLSTDESESQYIAADQPAIVQLYDEIFKNERDNTAGFPYGGIKQDYKSQDKYINKNGSYEKINRKDY